MKRLISLGVAFAIGVGASYAVSADTDGTEDTGFDKYISNTYVSSGNNMFIESADGYTYRAYFPIEEGGTFEYCFYFSNTVDSTYDSGELAYVGKSGGSYKIENASIADGGTSDKDPITNKTSVTFGGSSEKNVTADETYWSDPVEFTIEAGHYLVWEWTITGESIPCHNMSYLSYAGVDTGNGTFNVTEQIPVPQLIGCDREVKYNIAAIGDSITQGCQTEYMAYEYWAAQISQKLGDDYGFYNCGLGWSRASDAAYCNDWLDRAKTADIVIVAFGTNDISSGKYGSDEGDSAVQINGYMRTILEELTESGCKIILFNAPPENYNKQLEDTRLELNELMKITAHEYGALYFDFGGLLSDPSDASKAYYGAHPNGEGGNIVSDKFIEEYSELLEIK